VVWWPLLCVATVVIVFLASGALTSLLARTPLAVPLTGRRQQGTPELPIAFRTSAPAPVSPLIKHRSSNVNRERAMTASYGSASRRTAGGALLRPARSLAAGGPENPREKSGDGVGSGPGCS
jgi:hypothetical protein